MAAKTMERALLDLENEYWQAMKDKDLDAALRLTADPCLIVGAQGVRRVDTSMYEAMMRNTTWTLLDFKLGDDVCVETLGRNGRSSPTACTRTSHAMASHCRSTPPTRRRGCDATDAGCARCTPSA